MPRDCILIANQLLFKCLVTSPKQIGDGISAEKSVGCCWFSLRALMVSAQLTENNGFFQA